MKTVPNLANYFYESDDKYVEFIKEKFPTYEAAIEAIIELAEDRYDTEFSEWCYAMAEDTLAPDPDLAYERQVEENYGEFQRSLM